MKLITYIFGFVAGCTIAFTPVTSADAQSSNTPDSALLNALVKKGVLSDQEAEDITAQEEKQNSSTAASKIQLPSSVQSITFYGDLRLRYEMRDGSTPAGYTGTGGAYMNHGDSETLNRWRYRLRLGIKGTLYDNFFFGIRAATNPNFDRSGNVTLGHSDAAGPFGKDQNLMGLDQVYLGWHATDDITLTGGQMPNPLYTTTMIWSEDLNPAGAAEQWDHHFGDNLEVFATAGQFAYQAGNGNGITNGIGGTQDISNTFMFVEQAGIKYNFNKDTFFKGAATFYTYSGSYGTNTTSVAGLYSTSPINLAAPNNSPSYFNGPFVGAASAPGTNISGINDLAILEIPMEYDFKIGPGVSHPSMADSKDVKNVTEGTVGWQLPVRVFSDFAYNVDAEQRSDQARGAILNAESQNFVGNTHAAGNVGVTLPVTSASVVSTANPTGALTADNVATNNQMLNSNSFQGVLHDGQNFLDQAAYQVGVEVGQLKKKGDWDGKLYWQSTGYYAVDPNLVDADTFNSAVNMQGVVVSIAHNWTDGLTSTLRYAYAMPVDGFLATPNVNQDLTLGNIRTYNLFQADLLWKF